MAEKKRCGAKRRNGEPCQKWALKEKNRCRLHGGKSTGAPPKKMQKNKNAVKTGEYETIWLDTLDDEEKSLVSGIQVDILKMIDESIALLYVRERRMMQRINELRERKFNVISTEKKEGLERGEATSVHAKKGELNIETIQRIEDALTRLQDKKAKFLELRHKVESNESTLRNRLTESQIEKLSKEIEFISERTKVLKGTKKDTSLLESLTALFENE